MMRARWIRFAAAVLVLGGSLPAGFAQGGQHTLSEALAWLKKVQPSMDPTVKKDVPALEAILRRYFNEPDSLRASEEEIAVAFLDTMPSDDDLGGRGGSMDKMRKFESLLGAPAKPAPTPPKKTSGNKPPVKPPTPAKVTVKHKIPGIHAKATFSAVSRTAPGGKPIGAVMLSIGGRSKTVVEVLSGTSKLDVQRRAKVVADRMQALSKSNRLWWAMLKVSQVKGQYVVGTGGSNFVITADTAFAKEWGLTPSQLAKQLILKIRSSLDPEKSESFGGRDFSPEEMHVAAVDLRQEGDALYATSKAKAEEKYKSAIGNDPTYAVPYVRLADLYASKGDKVAAQEILKQGLAVEEMSADQKATLSAKLKKLS